MWYSTTPDWQKWQWNAAKKAKSAAEDSYKIGTLITKYGYNTYNIRFDCPVVQIIIYPVVKYDYTHYYVFALWQGVALKEPSFFQDISLLTYTWIFLILYLQKCCKKFYLGWWCSSTYSGIPCRRLGIQFPYPPILEKCAKGICLCNLLQSTQPIDRETVVEG